MHELRPLLERFRPTVLIETGGENRPQIIELFLPSAAISPLPRCDAAPSGRATPARLRPATIPKLRLRPATVPNLRRPRALGPTGVPELCLRACAVCRRTLRYSVSSSVLS